ncbi:FtsX-like permease family protein [Steroidobacter sp.]|uniref:FtsX-like permease family protein n=1 Tax=Steroidobacter sp. TaxID=1978227 RepID=UPI001A4ADF2B|nr:FtsX-like permease family protein [Steroidobacter sp.]MBL8265792.1 ABC transporter permease [Steroidobacter sp.]
MLRNYLAAALRNLARNRIYAFISVACLAVGLAATFITVAYVDYLRSYNRWIEGYERLYYVSMEYTLPGNAPIQMDSSPQDVAEWLRLNVPDATEVTRLVTGLRPVRVGDVEAVEPIAWANANVFKVLPMPAYQGDLATALEQPDSLVLTRSLARKYFGTDDVLGRTMEINREHPMVVRAVIEDLPSNTKLADEDIGILAADSAAFSQTALFPGSWIAYSYFRVDANVSLHRLNEQLARYERKNSSVVVRLSAGTLNTLGYSKERLAAVRAMPLLAGLALLISCMNFVNLTTARSLRRSTEVGVRKAAGASRWDLIVQFMGEALILSVIGMVAALSLCELSLPAVPTLLDVPLTFEYWRNVPLLLAIVGITAVTALLSGFYPAVLQARLQPAAILNGGKSRTGQSKGLRQALVVSQFAVLAVLLAAVVVAQSQLDHLLQKSLRFSGDQMLMIASTCRPAFINELRSLPAVVGVACSESAPLNLQKNNRVAKLADGTRRSFEGVRVDAGFFELYGLQPLAGRFFRANDLGDVLADDNQRVQRVVLNASAVRQFGFESAEAAIGRDPFPGADLSLEVIGVVEDFRLGRFDEPMFPMVYAAQPDRARMLSVKLRGEGVAETLERIDALWKQLGDPKPINRFFLSESIQDMHSSIVRQRRIFSAFAGLAVSLAIVGMLGLASSAAEERRLEIGVRKAFGAGVPDILLLILWRFVKLAGLAGILGGVLAVPLLNRWLQGFEDRIDLQPWVFVGTGVLIVVIAVFTVCIHATLMARAKPAEALR